MEALLVILGIVLYLLFEHPVIFWIVVALFIAIIVIAIAGAIKSPSEHRWEPQEEKISFFDDDSSEKIYKKHRAGQRCNGDCANCPPHYGYRYGRWYYGHDHIEGCEFGGNRGGGGMD